MRLHRFLACALIGGCALDFGLPVAPEDVPPSLHAVEPDVAFGGQRVALVGSHFLADPQAQSVRVGSSLAAVEHAATDRLVVRVPQLQADGVYDVTVTTKGGTSQAARLRFRGPGEPLESRLVGAHLLYTPVLGLTPLRSDPAVFPVIEGAFPGSAPLLRERLSGVAMGAGLADFAPLFFLEANVMLSGIPLSRLGFAVAAEARLLSQSPLPLLSIHSVEPDQGRLLWVPIHPITLEAATDPILVDALLPGFARGGAVELAVVAPPEGATGVAFSLLALYDAVDGGRRLVQMDLSRASPLPANLRPAEGLPAGHRGTRLVPHPTRPEAVLTAQLQLLSWKDGALETLADRPAGVPGRVPLEDLLAQAAYEAASDPFNPFIRPATLKPFHYLAAAYTPDGRALAVSFVPLGPAARLTSLVGYLKRVGEGASERWTMRGLIAAGAPLAHLCFACRGECALGGERVL